MRPSQPSRTMVNTAILRAAHQILDDDPKILGDPLAVGLVPEATADAIRESIGSLMTSQQTSRRSSMVLRSRYAEDRLAAAHARGVRQYAILAAGLDTFVWRQPKFGHDLRIFSLDMPASQNFARACFARCGRGEPENVTFVPLDLERTTLRNTLGSAGLDLAQPTFFSVLGLTQYLTADALDDLLRFTASAPRGSETVLSMHPPVASLTGPSRAWLAEALERCAGISEPWLTLLDPEDACAWLHRAGFSTVEQLTADVAQQRYFADRRDGLAATDVTYMIAGTC